MIGLVKRNLKIFFRDRSAVFFSLLGVFIIIGLYLLFLGEILKDSLPDIENARAIMDGWITGGMLAVSSLTTTLGAFGTMIDDKTKKIVKDFYSSPIKRSSIAGSYIFSSYIIGVIMTFIAWGLMEVYIISMGGSLPNLISFLKISGLILLSTFTSTSMVLFMVSFFNSQNAFASASTIIGTLIGFITGVYIPLGSMPEVVGYVIKSFPISHASVLFRQIIMEPELEIAFNNAPKEVLAEFKEFFGVTFTFGDHVITPIESILVLVATSIVFYGLAILKMSSKKV